MLKEGDRAMNLIRFFQSLSKREEGQTLSEYALILVLIAIVAIVAITLLGNQIAGVLTNIANNL
jgi:Flp pilus assembly pilin Flp